jgi:aminoglycoside 3-N-acetyltransferase
MLSKAQLIDQFRALGLRGGMDLMVHSSLRRVGKVSGGADAVLDAMIEILGPDGTLILPTHTWATVTRDQPVYHVRHTPSCVGALTEVFRKRDGVIRSLHPTHSVAAIGARAQQYTEGQLDVESPCPADSAYGRICANDGHILLLGVTMMNNTTLHYIEEEASLGGLYYDEKRTLVVIDADGAEHHLEIRPHRDDFREYKYWLDMEIPLHEAGILRFGRTGRGFSRLIAAGPFRRYMLRILRQSPEMLYKPGPWEDDDA